MSHNPLPNGAFRNSADAICSRNGGQSWDNFRGNLSSHDFQRFIDQCASRDGTIYTRNSSQHHGYGHNDDFDHGLRGCISGRIGDLNIDICR